MFYLFLDMSQVVGKHVAGQEFHSEAASAQKKLDEFLAVFV